MFSYDATNRAPGDPVVAMVMTGDPAVAAPGGTVTYQMTYTNLGPEASSNAEIRINDLPADLKFVSSNQKVVWDSAARNLLWRLGTVPVGGTHTVTLTTAVTAAAGLGDVVLTQAQFSGTHTYSPPAAAITVVGP